jgi:small GTP-binding protein
MADVKRTILPMMLLGDGQVGKTSLSLRLTGNRFDEALLTTIGKESYVYETELHGNKLKIKIWDTAGQERFKSMSVNVIKNVEGLILTYSIASKESFNNLSVWLEQLNNADDLSKKPVIIVGNKLDLEESREVSHEEGEKFAKEHNYNFYETSAKTGKNVKEAFFDIFEQLYKKFEDEITGKKSKKENIKIEKRKKNDNNKEKNKCC